MWSIIQAAGWPIWPLILASIIALALIFERLYSLRQSVVAPEGLVDRVLAEYRSHGATPELLTKTAKLGPLGRILAAGLANVKSPRPVMKEAIEEVGRVVTHELERFLTSLGTIASSVVNVRLLAVRIRPMSRIRLMTRIVKCRKLNACWGPPIEGRSGRSLSGR